MMSIAATPLSSNLKTLYRLVTGNSFIISHWYFLAVLVYGRRIYLGSS